MQAKAECVMERSTESPLWRFIRLLSILSHDWSRQAAAWKPERVGDY